MSQGPLRIVVMGTGPFAVPMFRALYDSRHQVVALVTQPPRAARGNRAPPVNPMRQVAESHGTPVLHPESVNTPEAREPLAALWPDLFVVADYGQILSPETLGVAPLGGVNLHGSLLPKYRGAAPINWAIWRGDRETGVTVIHMTPRVDAGPCLSQRRLTIGDEETAMELEHRLAELGAPLVCETIEALLAGDVKPLEQDPALASSARRLRKADGEVNWTKSAKQIHLQVRALEPWPRTASYLHRNGHPPLRLILGRVAASNDGGHLPPGTIVEANSERLRVATSEGALDLLEVQPIGKRMMPVGDFLRGHPVAVGERLGPENAA
jgi:methionyl-tRNA formyltransferase